MASTTGYSSAWSLSTSTQKTALSVIAHFIAPSNSLLP